MSLWPIPHPIRRAGLGRFRNVGSFLVAAILVFCFASILSAQTPSARTQKQNPLELLQSAHTLFLQRDYEAAREHYLEVLPSFPRNFDVLKNLAYCYFVRGPQGYAQAAKYYAQAYEINPQSAEVASNLARCLAGLNRPREAAAILEKLAAQPGVPAEAWKRTAEAYDQADLARQAESAYDAYLQRNPGDLDARVKLGDLYTREKSFERAQQQYRLALSTNPNYAPALIGMARVASRQGQLEESLQAYERVLRTSPDHGDALTGKAFTLLWLDRPEEAQALFSRLRERYPRSAEIARALEQAEAAVREKKLEAARRAKDTARIEAVYRERLAANPKDLVALKELAEATADPQRCRESIEFSRKGLEIAPNDTALELRMARSLVLCQQLNEAVERYRHVLASQPRSEGMLYELGSTLLRARRGPEAAEVFQNLLHANPKNSDARLGLALALAANRNYNEALAQYDEILKASPDHYDAQQGKAFVLYWTGQYPAAQAIFQQLASKRPDDRQNTEALENIARAAEDARWQAERPPDGSPPEDFLAYYSKRLASHPDDRTAMKGRAYTQTLLNNIPAAIQGYQQVLEKYPDDRGAKMELARLLAREGQYDQSIQLYQQVLQEAPEDTDALESLGRVYGWAGRNEDALKIQQGLVAKNPSSTSYQMDLARTQMRLRDYNGARKVYASVLAVDPQNHEARAQLARMELAQGNWDAAFQHYEYLLKENPRDAEALLGKGRIAFYRGDQRQAYDNASAAVEARPDNVEALFLLASVENARGHKRRALELLDRANQVSPNNPEITAMQRRLRERPVVIMRNSATYAREIGAPGEFSPQDAVPAYLRSTFEQALGPLQDLPTQTGLPNQDLRMYSFGTTFEFSALPKTDSYLSLHYLPSSSPPGPLTDSAGNRLPTGITGAVGPAQFLYRQNTRLADRFTLRLGGGLVRFGPGNLVDLPGQRSGGLKPINDLFGLGVLPQTVRDQIERAPSAEFNVLALGGFTYALTNKFSLDVLVNRSALTTSPPAVRLGVMENRFGGGLNFFFDPRTELHLDYSYRLYTTVSYPHYDLTNLTITRLPVPCVDVPLSDCFSATGTLVSENRPDHDQAHWGEAEFIRNLTRSDPVSFDLGYEGLAYGFAGPRRIIFMGFFNPSFYQQHLLTGRLYGKFAGPVEYDFSGGVGVRQNGQGEALSRAWRISPKFNFRVNRVFSFGVGYTHYTTAQALGPLEGNVVHFNTEWRF